MIISSSDNSPKRERRRRAWLERLCRYGARGALALERLSRAEDGRIAYRMKRPLPDGTTHLLFTGLGALALDGIRALMTIEGATTADVFEAFVEHMLVPRLNPGDIVVMDNVGAHKPAHILERIRAAGAHVLFLPPYSPDLNPIELFWNKLKELLKIMGARTRQARDAAIARAMEFITHDDIAGWFQHCGYNI